MTNTQPGSEQASTPLLIPFRAEHLVAFWHRDTLVREEMALAIQKEQGGPAYTALVGETILGSAGVILAWSGVGIVWANLSDRIALYKIWFHRTCKCALQDIIRAYGLHRIEAAIQVDNERNKAWIEALGFRREGGVARAYTPDRQDAMRYEMVVPEICKKGN